MKNMRQGNLLHNNSQNEFILALCLVILMLSNNGCPQNFIPGHWHCKKENNSHCVMKNSNVCLTRLSLAPDIEPDLSMTATTSIGARCVSSSWQGAFRVTSAQISSGLLYAYFWYSVSDVTAMSVSMSRKRNKVILP